MDNSFHEYEYVIQFRESKKHSQRFLDQVDDKWDSESFQEEYAVHIHLNEIYFKLKEKGLIVNVVRSERDVGLLSMLVDVPEELIERTAEMLQMELPLRVMDVSITWYSSPHTGRAGRRLGCLRPKT